MYLFSILLCVEKLFSQKTQKEKIILFPPKNIGKGTFRKKIFQVALKNNFSKVYKVWQHSLCKKKNSKAPREYKNCFNGNIFKVPALKDEKNLISCFEKEI